MLDEKEKDEDRTKFLAHYMAWGGESGVQRRRSRTRKLLYSLMLVIWVGNHEAFNE